nr:hypothetical protein [Tanacetum cinerariifolium]
ELAEYINTPGWNRPTFYDDDDDGNVDYTIAITPVLSIEEPDDSLSMRDEHLDTILATKSDEVIKSSVKDLVPIPSEFEGILDTIDDDSLYKENIEYVEASPYDSELVSLEATEIVIPEVEEIKDDNLRKKLLNVRLLIANIEALKDNPTPSSELLTKSSSTSPKSFLEETNTFHNSLPEFENFCFDLEEISSGSTTTHSDISLSEYYSFVFDPSNDQFPPTDRSDFTHEEFINELAHIISPPEYDCFYFRNLPDPGELMSILNSGIRENLSSTTYLRDYPSKHRGRCLVLVWGYLRFYYARSVVTTLLHLAGSQPMLKPSYKAKDGVIISIPPLIGGVADVESDEFIKSSVENLVPNPSESEDLSNIGCECDVPVCDDFSTFSNLLFDVDDNFSSSDEKLFSDEDVPKEIYSNLLFNEEIISIKIDSHHFNVESDLIESFLDQDSLIISSSKIDSLLDEFVGELIFLKSIPPGIDEANSDPAEEIRLINKLLYDNSSPRPLEEIKSENSDIVMESFSPSLIPLRIVTLLWRRSICLLLLMDPYPHEDDEVSMNPRCSGLLQNQLPPKENDPRSFILPCLIRRLDFNNDLAGLGASISIMPYAFFMFKRLGIGKLKPINMVIEMADDTKCILKRIVKNMLIKIDKFILPVDFVILEMIEDFRMPIILGRPLLTTAHAKIDIFRNTISFEVGNEKVIFKMRSNISDNVHESVRMTKTDMNTKEDELIKINFDSFTYNADACKINHLLSINPDVFTYDIKVQESYEEIIYRCSLIAQEENGGLRFEEVSETAGDKILRDHWRKRFRNQYDDIEEFKDPVGCEESKENKIIGIIINKLYDEWFKGTHEDDEI